MDINKNEIKESINIIDGALMEGYGVDDTEHAEKLLKIMVQEIDANKLYDNYFKEVYGIE
ncbi:hypothetical protein [Peptostreptococcus porci]|uniref:hypothetical protein n=1 Tax=Peptostreptococcus porci TaxID=2652282 RepID=UPI002A8315EB|nr:hypothetical protein [Peptostreptococcus porci]MDY4127669.1 hypothetical protein [Peptostreptococcus porci]